MDKHFILDKATAARKITRLAYEIAERNAGEEEIVLAGIHHQGAVLAAAIANVLQTITPATIRRIDVLLDKRHPKAVTLSEQMNFDDKVIILIDDVANSGKTMLYALQPFLAFYPRKIQTLVLVERTHKTFPIQADYVGLSVATTIEDHIFVVIENEEIIGAYLS